MDANSIKEIIIDYTELTKITTICLDSSHRDIPLFTQGLDINSLIEYTEYKEVILFLNSEFCQSHVIRSNHFHTFYTTNNYIYNIIFLTLDTGIEIELITGPIFSSTPDYKALDDIIKNINIPIYKKNAYFETISKVPILSKDSIYQRGNLLLAMCTIQSWHSHSSVQEFHGNINSVAHFSYTKSDSDEYKYDSMNKFQDLYRFYISLKDHILSGKPEDAVHLLQEYDYLFVNKKSYGNNYRNLKNQCIITCTMACHHSIQANAPYEKMCSKLVKSITGIEKATNAMSAILVMTKTIQDYVKAVAALSDNQYSLHINRVLQYLRYHFTEKITLKMLADYLSLNPVYLSSLIKKETNLSLSDHINMIRIEKSKPLLIESNKSIQEIAFYVGYNYQNHYDSVFKKLEGITPSEYRKKQGNNLYKE